MAETGAEATGASESVDSLLPLWAAWVCTALASLAVKAAVYWLRDVAPCWGRRTTKRQHQGILSVHAARKVLHICMGLCFMACWPLFPPHPWSSFVAASVPLAITAQFAATGVGWMHDPATVDVVCRTGQAKELLGGPLQYGVIHVLATVLSWRSSVGVACLVALCAGDGAAALVGQSIPRPSRWRLPWNKHKTWQGTLAFVLASVAAWTVLGVEGVVQHVAEQPPQVGSIFGLFPRGQSLSVVSFSFVVCAAAAVESLPGIGSWDNTLVATTAGALTMWLQLDGSER